VTYELITRENVEQVRQWWGSGQVRRFERFLNRGDVGIYALFNGEVIHYGWVAFNLPGHAWIRTHDPIQVGDALLHRGYTRENYRRRGVSAYAIAYLMTFLYEQYRHQGLRRVCSLVEVDNTAPQRLFTKLGFYKAQHIELIRLLGTIFLYRSCAVSADVASVPRQLRVRFKIPEIWWDSRMPKSRRDKEVAP
jgi:GNAT superfamily N-acetyltransferase